MILICNEFNLLQIVCIKMQGLLIHTSERLEYYPNISERKECLLNASHLYGSKRYENKRYENKSYEKKGMKKK